MSKVLKTLKVKENSVTLFSEGIQDYISLTDIARYQNPDEPKDIIKNWIRNRSTIEFLGLWERINNPEFKGVEFDSFLYQAGSNSFTLSPSKWIEKTRAIGIITKLGKGGGTYAQKDIAFEFASWISAEFKLYLIKEFQRLKEAEQNRQSLGWNLNRMLAKVNYTIHTDAVKEELIPPKLTQHEAALIYASEADLLNKALYGITAKEWRKANTDKEGNIRDHSTMEQLLVLANMESMNAEFIRMGLSAEERILKLNAMARQQIQSLLKHQSIKKMNG